MKAKNLMNPSPVTIQADATIRELVNLLNNEQRDGVCVVEGKDRLVGVITLFELYQAFLPDYVKMKESLAHMISETYFEKTCKHLGDTPVHSIMRKDLIKIREDDNLISIVADIAKYRLMVVPVTRGETLLGTIHKKNILSYAGKVLIGNNQP